MPRWDNTLFFIGRHGETASNELNIYRAWSNKPEAQLNASGRESVKLAAEYLIAQRATIELILADTLDRTMETAEIYSTILGVSQIVPLRGLHPLNMGDLTGKNKDKYPVDEYVKNPKKRIPGGETLDEFDNRELAIFKGIMALIDGLSPGSVLLAGHGSTISFLHNRVFDQEAPNVGYEGLVDPGGLVAAERDGLTPLTRVRQGRDARMSADQAGYMELPGAVKDGDCQRVKVANGISQHKGCCNEYRPGKSSDEFRCGECKFVTLKGGK